MSTSTPQPEGWTRTERPASLFRRFDFTSYPETRSFLDRLGQLSEQTGLYPDLSFGPAYVNVTVRGLDVEILGPAEQQFAARAATLVSAEVG
jgi:pterin-4a-carbinolamine dehydratase